MDMRLDEILAIEHAGWSSLCDGRGGDFDSETMTEDARIVLADGSVMCRDHVRASLEHAPPWSGYTIIDAELRRIGESTVASIDTGTSHRDDGDDFTALMASVDVSCDGR